MKHFVLTWQDAAGNSIQELPQGLFATIDPPTSRAAVSVAGPGLYKAVMTASPVLAEVEQVFNASSSPAGAATLAIYLGLARLGALDVTMQPSSERIDAASTTVEPFVLQETAAGAYTIAAGEAASFLIGTFDAAGVALSTGVPSHLLWACPAFLIIQLDECSRQYHIAD